LGIGSRPGRMAPYKPESYSEVLRWLEDTQVEYVPHGKKAGTKSFDRYERYAKAKTVAEALELGSKPLDLVHDFEKKLLRRAGGPIRDKPLDLTELEDTTKLTKTDLVLARWGYNVAKKEEVANSEEAAAGEDHDFEKRKREAAEALRKARLSAKFGVKVEDMATRVSWAETPTMVASRSRANVEAAKILDEKRKIVDNDVLRVLRLWAIKRNNDRKNVFPDGVSWVHSEVIGLLHCSGGRLIATLHTRSYPKVVELLVRWMKDNRPEGHSRDFPFTSIIVNSGYSARKHRDHLNVGPAVVKAFGNFQGGELRYWANDDKSATVEALKPEDGTLFDVSSAAAVIDGNRAHGVEPYTGEERYSLVFYTTAAYNKATPEVRQPLAELGFPFTAEEDEAYLRSLVPAPERRAPRAARRPQGLLRQLRASKKLGLRSGGLLGAMLGAARKAAAEAKADAPAGGPAPERLAPKPSGVAPATGSPVAGAEAAGTQGCTPSRKRPRSQDGDAADSAAKRRAPPKACGGRGSIVAGAATEEAGPDASVQGPFDAFSAFANALASAASAPAAAAAAALSEYLVGVADEATSAEDTLCAVLALLGPSSPVPDKSLGAAVAEAFGEPQFAALEGEALAMAALGCRRRAATTDLGKRPPLSVMQVADAMAKSAAGKGKVAELVSLIARSSAEGLEALYLVKCLQGRLGLETAVKHRAVATALARTSASRSMTT